MSNSSVEGQARRMEVSANRSEQWQESSPKLVTKNTGLAQARVINVNPTEQPQNFRPRLDVPNVGVTQTTKQYISGSFSEQLQDFSPHLVTTNTGPAQMRKQGVNINHPEQLQNFRPHGNMPNMGVTQTRKPDIFGSSSKQLQEFSPHLVATNTGPAPVRKQGIKHAEQLQKFRSPLDMSNMALAQKGKQAISVRSEQLQEFSPHLVATNTAPPQMRKQDISGSSSEQLQDRHFVTTNSGPTQARKQDMSVSSSKQLQDFSPRFKLVTVNTGPAKTRKQCMNSSPTKQPLNFIPRPDMTKMGVAQTINPYEDKKKSDKSKLVKDGEKSGKRRFSGGTSADPGKKKKAKASASSDMFVSSSKQLQDFSPHLVTTNIGPDQTRKQDINGNSSKQLQDFSPHSVTTITGSAQTRKQDISVSSSQQLQGFSSHLVTTNTPGQARKQGLNINPEPLQTFRRPLDMSNEGVTQTRKLDIAGGASEQPQHFNPHLVTNNTGPAQVRKQGIDMNPPERPQNFRSPPDMTNMGVAQTGKPAISVKSEQLQDCSPHFVTTNTGPAQAIKQDMSVNSSEQRQDFRPLLVMTDTGVDQTKKLVMSISPAKQQQDFGSHLILTDTGLTKTKKPDMSTHFSEQQQVFSPPLVVTDAGLAQTRKLQLEDVPPQTAASEEDDDDVANGSMTDVPFSVGVDSAKSPKKHKKKDKKRDKKKSDKSKRGKDGEKSGKRQSSGGTSADPGKKKKKKAKASTSSDKKKKDSSSKQNGGKSNTTRPSLDAKGSVSSKGIQIDRRALSSFMENSGGKQGKKRSSVASEEPEKKRKKEGIPCYPMSATPCGTLLIINNEIFLDKDLIRKGTNKDCENIKSVFQDFLGFRVVTKKDLTLAEMRQAFHDILKEDLSSFDCFAAVIMSHGMMNGICGTDSNDNMPESVLNVQEVFEIMDNCPSLTGKPKLLFTQACRGGKMFTPDSAQLDAFEVESDDILTQSDILISYSTIEGYGSVRHRIDGTWYINSLCEVLREHAEIEDLNSMLTMLNLKVGEKSENMRLKNSLDLTKVKQTAEYTSRLTKKLFFKPVKGAQVLNTQRKATAPSSRETRSTPVPDVSGGVISLNRSKLSTVLGNQKLEKSKSLHVKIQEVEYDCEYQGGEWLPGKYMVTDSSSWAYLKVFGKAKKRDLCKDKSIMLKNIKSVTENVIECDASDLEPLSTSVPVKEEIVRKMKVEEEFSTLTSMKKDSKDQKTKVVVTEVGVIEQLEGRDGKQHPVRRLKVKDIISPGKYGKEYILEAHKKTARFPYKPQDIVIFCNVGKTANEVFRTYRNCSVRIADDQPEVKLLPVTDDKSPAQPAPTVPSVKRSKLSTVLSNRKLEKSKVIHVKIQEVEYDCEYQGGEWLPGKYIIVDSFSWAYLKVFGKAKKGDLCKDKSIMLKNIKSITENVIECFVSDLEPLGTPVPVKGEIKVEEKFSTLTSIKKDTQDQKTKVLVSEVGTMEQREVDGKPYPVRHLKVKDILSTGKYGKEHTLEVHNKTAKFPYRPQEVVIFCNVGKTANGVFRTYRNCYVRAQDTHSQVTALPSKNEKNPAGPATDVPPVKRSKLSTVLSHRKLEKSKALHLKIQEVEYDCEYQGGEWLPGKYMVTDSFSWGYLTVFGKAKKGDLCKDKSIMLKNIKSVSENVIECFVSDLEPLGTPVPVKGEIVEKMKVEEKFSTLTSMKKDSKDLKTKVLVSEVGTMEQREVDGKPYPVRHLKVKDILSNGKYGKEHTLEVHSKTAKFPYKPEEVVIFCNVGKTANGVFRTYRNCSVRVNSVSVSFEKNQTRPAADVPPVKQSRLLTVLSNHKLDKSKALQLKIQEVEYDCECQRGECLPGKYMVMDSSSWAYLKVFGKAKKNDLCKDKSIMLKNIKCVTENVIECDASDLEPLSTSVPIKGEIVQKMKVEEKFSTLTSMKKDSKDQKTKVVVSEVGIMEQREVGGKPYPVRHLKVKDILSNGKYGKEHTLEVHNKTAKFPYRPQEVVIFCNVGKTANGVFRTYRNCSVRA